MIPEARCLLCDFEVESVEGLTGCPSCHTTSKPVKPSEDVSIKINLWELKLLCTWAEMHGMKADEKSQHTIFQDIKAIVRRLRTQIPKDYVLLLSEEIGQVKQMYGKVQTSMPLLDTPTPDMFLTCQHCGSKYKFTQQDQKDSIEDEATGDILEGNDSRTTCPSCRIKQDGQRI